MSQDTESDDALFGQADRRYAERKKRIDEAEKHLALRDVLEDRLNALYWTPALPDRMGLSATMLKDRLNHYVSQLAYLSALIEAAGCAHHLEKVKAEEGEEPEKRYAATILKLGVEKKWREVRSKLIALWRPKRTDFRIGVDQWLRLKLPREIFSDTISPDFRYASHARWFAEEAPAELGEAAAKLSAAAPSSGKAGDAGGGSHDDNGERKERPNKGANNAGTQATGARLTRTEEAVLSIIKKQRKGKGIQWKGISAQLKKKGIQLAKSTFYKPVITKLKAHYGVVNSSGAGGYLIPLPDE